MILSLQTYREPALPVVCLKMRSTSDARLSGSGSDVTTTVRCLPLFEPTKLITCEVFLTTCQPSSSIAILIRHSQGKPSLCAAYNIFGDFIAGV